MTFESEEDAQQAYNYLREEVKEFQVEIVYPYSCGSMNSNCNFCVTGKTH